MQFSVSLRVIFYTTLHLFLLCAVLFFWQLEAYSLFNITEARQAEIARQILVRQDWLTPVYNGEIYFDKPILLHWLMALGYQLWGETAWAVRLPSAIAATFLVLVTYPFTRQFYSPRLALLAATSLAANPFTFTLGRTGQHDMLLTLFFTAAMFAWYSAHATGQRSRYLLFFGLLGLAILSKGPIALVLAILTIGMFLLLLGRLRQHWLKVPWRWGLGVVGAIVLPWYLGMTWRHGWEFVDQAFLFHNVSRFVSPNLNQSGDWWYYLPVLWLGLFAWLPLFPVQSLAIELQQVWQGRVARNLSGLSIRSQLHLFLWVWFVVVIGFMSVASTKLPWYIYPGVPPFLILCAIGWDDQIRSPSRRLRMSLSVILMTYLVFLIAFTLVPQILTDPMVNQAVLRTHAIEIGVGISAIAALALSYCVATRNAMAAALTNVIAFGLIGAMVVSVLLPGLDREAMGGRLLPIASVLNQEFKATAGDVAVAIGVVEPSLNFYSRVDRIYRVEDYVKPDTLNLCLPEFAAPHLPLEIQAEVRRSQRLFLITNRCVQQVKDFNLRSIAPFYQANGFQLFILPIQRGDS